MLEYFSLSKGPFLHNFTPPPLFNPAPKRLRLLVYTANNTHGIQYEQIYNEQANINKFI